MRKTQRNRARPDTAIRNKRCADYAGYLWRSRRCGAVLQQLTNVGDTQQRRFSYVDNVHRGRAGENIFPDSRSGGDDFFDLVLVSDIFDIFLGKRETTHKQ